MNKQVGWLRRLAQSWGFAKRKAARPKRTSHYRPSIEALDLASRLVKQKEGQLVVLLIAKNKTAAEGLRNQVEKFIDARDLLPTPGAASRGSPGAVELDRPVNLPVPKDQV